jgi:hypothetical protein
MLSPSWITNQLGLVCPGPHGPENAVRTSHLHGEKSRDLQKKLARGN